MFKFKLVLQCFRREQSGSGFEVLGMGLSMCHQVLTPPLAVYPQLSLTVVEKESPQLHSGSVSSG